jgi:AraC-like DNA-binding protein
MATQVKRPPRSALVNVRDFIRQNCTRLVTLDELARVSGLSRFHLVRIFAKEFGLPPHAYQIYIQIERAKALLDAGMLPAVVAAETGFSDQSHFTRHFKKLNGITPRAYVAARKGKSGV